MIFLMISLTIALSLPTASFAMDHGAPTNPSESSAPSPQPSPPGSFEPADGDPAAPPAQGHQQPAQDIPDPTAEEVGVTAHLLYLRKGH